MPKAHEIIDQIPRLRDTVISAIEPLSGGLTNTAYLIHADCQRYVLRLAGPHAEELGINRQTEYQALQRVSQAGIFPEMLWYDASNGNMLYRFVEGHAFTVPEFKEPAVIERVAPLLRKVHSLAAIEGVFSPYQQIDERLVIAKSRGAELPDNLDAIVARAHEIEASRAHVTPVLCHGDPFHNNFIDAEGRLYLIDWEFGGMCDPMFDLVSATYFCQPEGRDVMIQAYYGQVTAADRQAMQDVWYVVALWNATWAVLQGANQRDDFDYAAMARNIFKRLTGIQLSLA